MNLEDKKVFIYRAHKKYEVEKLQGKTNLDFTEGFKENFTITKTEFKL